MAQMPLKTKSIADGEEMKKKISASTLAILGSIFAASANAQTPGPSIYQVEQQSIEAALVLKELQKAGLIKIDPKNGTIQMKGSVLEVLQATDWASITEVGSESASVRTDRCRCGSTSER